jgi:hypothetical protein
MIKFRRERELYMPVSGYVRRKGFRWQQAEMKFYEYRIDLYGFSRVSDCTVAIELKLADWRRALSQTLVYQLAADLVYAALPRYSIVDAALAEFAVYGIGVIGVGPTGRCEQVLASRQSNDVREWYRQHYVSLLQS